eukprot:4154558-Pyramimonas_sp.AAC.1
MEADSKVVEANKYGSEGNLSGRPAKVAKPEDDGAGSEGDDAPELVDSSAFRVVEDDEEYDSEGFLLAPRGGFRVVEDDE